jgi:hypothetical protein
LAVTDEAASALADALRDRYRLARELGRGGTATVYLADDLLHDRLVALKILRPEIAAALGPERFLREIRLTARLQHPHILTVLAPARLLDVYGLRWRTSKASPCVACLPMNGFKNTVEAVIRMAIKATTLREDHVSKRETPLGRWFPVTFYAVNLALWIATGIRAEAWDLLWLAVLALPVLGLYLWQTTRRHG